MNAKHFLLAATLLTGTASSLSAASPTWDGTGTTPAAPGNASGAWDTTTLNWSDGSTDAAWVNANNDTAVFGGGTTTGTPGSVTLGTGITVGGLTFGTTGFTLAGNTLTLAGTTPTITTGTGVTATVNSVVAGSAGLTNAGTGTLVLGGTNTFTGGVNLTGGTLQIASAGNLPSGNTLTFTNNAVLNTAAITLANKVVIAAGQSGTIKSPTVSGTRTTLTGDYSGVAGTLTLDMSGAAGYGGFSVDGSSGLAAGSTVNLLGATGAADVAVLVTTANSQTFFANTVLNITASGTGQTYIAGANSANVNFQVGALNGGNGSTKIGFDNSNVNRTVTINGVADGNYSGYIYNGTYATAPVNLVKKGSSTQTLSGANTYTGTTTINAGALKFAKQVSLYNNTTGSWTATNIIVNAGATAAFNVGGTGEFTSGNIDTLKALGTVSGGFKNGSRIGLDTTNAAGGNFSYANAIANTNGGANSLGLDKLGTGTLTLSGANTHTGGTAVKAGTLALGSGGSIIVGAGDVTIASGATLALASGSTLHLASVTANIANSGTLSGAGDIDLGGFFNGWNSGASGSYTLVIGGDSTGGLFTVSNYDTGVWSSVLFNGATGKLDFTAVPEPAAYGLLGAGALAGFAFVRRRRRRM